MDEQTDKEIDVEAASQIRKYSQVTIYRNIKKSKDMAKQIYAGHVMARMWGCVGRDGRIEGRGLLQSFS